MSIESVTPSNHLVLCHPFLLLPSIFPSISVFSNELALHIWGPKYWSLSFRISPSEEYSGLILISFRIDWFDILVVQGMSCPLLGDEQCRGGVGAAPSVSGPEVGEVLEHHLIDFSAS